MFQQYLSLPIQPDYSGLKLRAKTRLFKIKNMKKYITPFAIIVLLLVAYLFGQLLHRFNPATSEIDSRTWGQELTRRQ